METRQFNVTGMSCAACSSRVEKAVSALRGVSAAEVNLLTNSLKATFDENMLDVSDIERAVCDAGYGASERSAGGRGKARVAASPETDARSSARGARARLMWSLALLAPLMWLSMGPMGGLARSRHARRSSGRADDGLHAVSAVASRRASQPALLHGRLQGAREPGAQYGQSHRGRGRGGARLRRLCDLQASGRSGRRGLGGASPLCAQPLFRGSGDDRHAHFARQVL